MQAPDGACTSFNVGFEHVTPTLMVLVGSSSTMGAPFGETTRWKAVRTAVLDLAQTVQSSARTGLLVIGGPTAGGETAACSSSLRVMPALNNRTALDRVLPADPGSATHGAIDEGIKAAVGAFTTQTATGPKYILLLVDSNPGSCSTTDETQALWTAIRAEQDAFQKGVQTKVLGISNDVPDTSLNQLANAGVGAAVEPPTGVYYRATDARSLDAAISDFAQTLTRCVFSLGNAVDAGQASAAKVSLDGAPLAYGDPHGWRLNSSTELEVLGNACQRARTTAKAIAIEFPCGAVTVK